MVAVRSSCRPIRSNEIGEVWAQSRDAVLVLAGFAAAERAADVWQCSGAHLRSLENLSAAFDHIGKGDYHGSLPAHGPPELTRLANGFNVMTRTARHGGGAEPPIK